MTGVVTRRSVLVCVWVIGVVVQGEGEGDKVEGIVESVRRDIRKVVDEKCAIDVGSFVRNVHEVRAGVSPRVREKLMKDLGRMLLYEGDISSRPEYLPGLREPRQMVRAALIDAFSRLGSEEDVECLLRFYEAHGADGYPELPAVIVKLGGTLPQKVKETQEEKESAAPVSAEEKEARRKEVQAVLKEMASTEMASERLARAVQRIGEIGESQDAMPIIEKARQRNAHWIVRQQALRALGKLGGRDARNYLLEQVQAPMPRDADLDDYGDIQAMLRSQAALALGECGDATVVNILDRISKDEKQFKRVKEGCSKAIAQILRRSQSQP